MAESNERSEELANWKMGRKKLKAKFKEDKKAEKRLKKQMRKER